VLKTIYTAHAHVEGGRADGVGRTSDGSLDVRLRRPTEIARGEGTNPEQLFAIGYAACLAGAIVVFARRNGSDPGGIAIDSSVSLIQDQDGSYRLGVGFDITLPHVDDDSKAVEFVKGAHSICPYSNAIRGNVDVALTVNGKIL
jgi:Ohr subfamily peroxiredoxin